MIEKFEFAWIDDTPERARNYIGALAVTLRGKPVDANLEVFPIQENFINDVSNRAGEWSKSPPSLIMIDHSFTKVDHRVFNIQGSALAHLLRLQLPTIPMVCVSGQNFDTDDFSVEDISEYTYMFPITTLNDEVSLESLFAIAKDFPLFQFPDKQGVRNLLVEALHAPEADKQALRNVLPEEFEETFKHSTSPHRLARWVLNVLMNRPGFLSDPLEVATILGLTENAFLEKVAQHFSTALYKGPFATERKPLWWTTSIVDVLYEILPSEAALLPNEAGRRLPSIEEADYSCCAVSGEVSPPPDVVAYNDATASTRHAVRNVYTEPLSEEASSLLGFSTRLKIRNTRRRS